MRGFLFKDVVRSQERLISHLQRTSIKSNLPNDKHCTEKMEPTVVDHQACGEEPNERKREPAENCQERIRHRGMILPLLSNVNLAIGRSIW